MWDNLVTYIKEITFIGELKSAIQILENLNSAHAEFAKPLYKILKCKLFLNQSVFQENKIYNIKTHLFSFLNTKQRNDGIFLNTSGDNFDLANIFWNVRVRL